MNYSDKFVVLKVKILKAEIFIILNFKIMQFYAL